MFNCSQDSASFPALFLIMVMIFVSIICWADTHLLYFLGLGVLYTEVLQSNDYLLEYIWSM